MCHMIQRLIHTIYFLCAGPNLYTPVPSLNATIGAVSAQPWVKLVHQLSGSAIVAHLLPVGLPQGVTRNVTVTDIWESCFQYPGGVLVDSARL